MRSRSGHRGGGRDGYRALYGRTQVGGNPTPVTGHPGTGPQRDVGPITEVEVVAVDQAPDRSVALLAREAFGVQDPGPCEGHERDFAASAQPQR